MYHIGVYAGRIQLLEYDGDLTLSCNCRNMMEMLPSPVKKVDTTPVTYDITTVCLTWPVLLCGQLVQVQTYGN